MRPSALFGLIVLIHATAIGLFSLMQGCATRRPGEGLGGTPAATERASTEGTASTEASPASAPPAASPTIPGDVTPLPPKRTTAAQVKPPVVKLHTPGLSTGRTASSATKTPIVAPLVKRPLPKEGTPYVIKSGDVLSKIAVSYGVSTLELSSYNGLSNPGAIRVGQKIMIPPGATKKPTPTVAASALAPATHPAATPALPATLSADEYKVQSGDILGRVAARHGVTTAALKKANNLTSDTLRINQVLKIPGKSAAPAGTNLPTLTPAGNPPPVSAPVVTAPALVEPAINVPPAVTDPVASVSAVAPVASDLSKPFEYVVPEGESLDDIARMFIVTPDSIRKLNVLGPSESVKAGQRIKIPPSQY